MAGWWILVCAQLLGLFRGIDEGMTMIQQRDPLYDHQVGRRGVRAHRWFRWYHAISLAPYLLLIAIMAVLPLEPGLAVYYLGLGMMIWEYTEIGENVARYGVPIIRHEHVNFAEIIKFDVDGERVCWLHVIRTVLACLLIGLGR